MDIVYQGPHLFVEIAGTDRIAPIGKTVAVPDDVGESLLQQSTWSRPATDKTKGGN